jgi:hypothetical protein
MKRSPTNPKTRGFTLVELLIAGGLASVVGLMTYGVMTSTMRLSAQNTVTNVSNFRARQTLDRLGEIVRFAYNTPVLVKADGTTTSGSTGDGLLIKNTLPGPYVFKNANGQAETEIPSGSTSFIVEYAPGAGVEAPKVGDYFLLNLSTQPELEVATVAPASSGTIAKVLITTKQALRETARPGNYSVTACRYRKEAYIFAPSGNQWTLRHYPRVVSGMNYANIANYRELGTGFQKLNGQEWFTTVAEDGTQACWLRALARSSNRGEYTELKSGRNTLTTMPVQVKLWNYTAPPPPQS